MSNTLSVINKLMHNCFISYLYHDKLMNDGTQWGNHNKSPNHELLLEQKTVRYYYKLTFEKIIEKKSGSILHVTFGLVESLIVRYKTIFSIKKQVASKYLQRLYIR